MGSSNWAPLNDALNIASLDRGPTTGIARPNGGGNFVYAFNSLVLTPGAAGWYANGVNFAPTPANKGGSITGAIQRGISAGAINFAPFFFMLGQGQSVNDSAYMLGLQDDSPYRIALRKGALVNGIPAGAANPGGPGGILRRSTATFTPGAFHHLRLDTIVNLNGDVIIKAFQSNLAVNSVAAPSWAPIAGLEDPALVASHGVGTCFVDDALGVNSGSQPFTSGYMGFGFQSADISRRGYFDHIEAFRQS